MVVLLVSFQSFGFKTWQEVISTLLAWAVAEESTSSQDRSQQGVHVTLLY